MAVDSPLRPFFSGTLMTILASMGFWIALFPAQAAFSRQKPLAWAGDAEGGAPSRDCRTLIATLTS